MFRMNRIKSGCSDYRSEVNNLIQIIDYMTKKVAKENKMTKYKNINNLFAWFVVLLMLIVVIC